MLTRKYIEKIRRMDAQYGAPEDTFSPDWHAKNPPQPETSVLAGTRVEKSAETITLRLRYLLMPSGDITVANVDENFVMPEGASFVE